MGTLSLKLALLAPLALATMASAGAQSTQGCYLKQGVDLQAVEATTPMMSIAGCQVCSVSPEKVSRD